MEKVIQKQDELGNNISILNIKEMVIAKNVLTIVERLELVESDYEFENKRDKEKIRNSIVRLRETNEILKSKNMHYKFNGLFITDRTGALAEAKWDPLFIAKWKMSIDTVAIPPTILVGINQLRVTRAYDHIKFNDVTDERSNIGAALVEFASIRTSAVNTKITKKFTIACSFTEGLGGQIGCDGKINYAELGL